MFIIVLIYLGQRKNIAIVENVILFMKNAGVLPC